MRLAGAIDIGGTAVKIGIVDEGGTIIKRVHVPTAPDGEPAALVDAIVATLQPMLDAAKGDRNAASGIGVSVAGFLDPQRLGMIHNANLVALQEFPLRRTLEKRFSLECSLEVDSNAAVVAEYRHGAGRGSTRLLGVTLGTGLGGGVIIDRQLLRYTGECAGDIGHIIVDRNGRLCTCGARGCLEAMVNVAALSERAGGRMVRDIITSAREGDQTAINALAETGWWLGLGLASLSPLFSPDTIAVGGGISAAGELLLESVRASYHLHARPEFRDYTRVVGSSFEGWEGMIGAASLFLDPIA
ncbi:MAG TPA: ROK family protein [Gemmatimonadaceae bacterium]|nr:ROK family protein [Gemmatimonadaceae bacterium]